MNKTNFLDQLTIHSLLDWGEDCELEYKSARGGLPGNLWESYSAFANTNGGIILLGVEKDGVISGINKSLLPKLKKSFWDTVNNHGKVSINLLTDDNLKEIPYGAHVILAILVPRASRYQRPVYLGQNPLTGTYRRNYEGDYHCSEQEVGRMLSDRSEESSDYKIVKGISLADLDRRSLQEYRQRFASHQPTHPWLSEDDVGFLRKLGGWRHNKDSNLEGVTMAGILMFGTDETIRETIPQYQIDYREKFSLDPQVRWTDRVTIDGTWNANLFQFYLKVIHRLGQDLKLPFQLDQNLFRKGETVVHEAIREALVNSLIHADYLGKGGIVIEKSRDRFEFSNPGSLLIPINQFHKSRSSISECRNKTLQQMFMLIGAAEKAGSGIDKIYRGWESQHWRKPAIFEEFQPDRVHWILPMTSLIPEESLSNLKKYFGSKFQKLSKLEVQALVTADIEGYVDNARMCQITNNHSSDITKLLQSLVSCGMLSQESKNRWARYKLNSVHKENNSVHKENNSVHKENNSIYKDFSQQELSILKEIAAPALENKRMDPILMENVIRNLCENRWLSRRQIADLLNRNLDSLRTRFLTPMVERQILYLRYPDKPNRVDQAYSTSKNTENLLS